MFEFIKEKFFLDKLSIKINESFDYLFKIFIIPNCDKYSYNENQDIRRKFY